MKQHHHLKWIASLKELQRFLIMLQLVCLLAGCRVAAAIEVEPRAPQPSSPADGALFADPALDLVWDWPAGLQEEQAFAVRIWSDDKDVYQEIWSSQPSVNAKAAIESLGGEVGEYYWQVAVIQVSQERGVEGVVSEWSTVQTLQRVRHINPTPVPVELQSDAARFISSQAYESTTALIDGVRDFVHSNSTDERGQEPGLPDRTDTIQQIYEHSQGHAEAPSLLCDGRSTSMLTLLLGLGVDSRLIFLYGDSQGSIVEHTMLEVFNPDSQQWELQDPTNNVYIADDTGQRVSIQRAVFGSLNSLRACSATACTRQELEWFVSYFQAYRYGYTNEVWINPDRFNVSKRFPDEEDMNLVEYLTYGNSLEFTFHFSPDDQ